MAKGSSSGPREVTLAANAEGGERGSAGSMYFTQAYKKFLYETGIAVEVFAAFTTLQRIFASSGAKRVTFVPIKSCRRLSFSWSSNWAPEKFTKHWVISQGWSPRQRIHSLPASLRSVVALTMMYFPECFEGSDITNHKCSQSYFGGTGIRKASPSFMVSADIEELPYLMNKGIGGFNALYFCFGSSSVSQNDLRTYRF